MKMKSIVKAIGASAVLATATMPAHADLMLDGFDQYQIGLTDTTATGTESDTANYMLFIPGVGNVPVSVEYVLNAFTAGNQFSAVSVAANEPPEEGWMVFSEGQDKQGELTVTYSSVAPIPFSSFGSAIQFNYISIDEDMDATIEVCDNTSTCSSVNVTIPGSQTPGTFSVDLSSFTGVDMANVTSASANVFSDGDNAGFTLDDISLVPEPATLGVLGLGLMGLGLRRRQAVK